MSMLQDQIALLNASTGKEARGRLQVFDYIVLIHPEEGTEDRDTTKLHKSGRILARNQQCATMAIIADLEDEVRQMTRRVEVGVRPF